MKKYPQFSVLMSVYYKEKAEYLNLALNSIEYQTIKPTEIILVEDGELTSELYSVIEQHQKLLKQKLKIVKNKKNKGLGLALHEGTKHVTTDWIARMDTDDISIQNRFELQLNEIKKNPDIAVIGGQVNEFLTTPQRFVGKRRVPLSQEKIYEYIKYRNPFNHPTVMINKKKLIDIGGYRNSDRLEDYDLWVRFVERKERLLNLKNVLVYMRVGTDMYKRRGGLKYLRNYMHMKNNWRKLGVGNYSSMFLSDILMTANVFMPVKIRKYMYQKFLHKN